MVDNINKRCDCEFTEDGVVDGVYLCFSANADSVTFRGALRGMANVDSATLAGYVIEWVSTGQTVLIRNIHYVLDSSCKDEVVIDDLTNPECRQGTDSESSSFLSTGVAAGISTGAILVVIFLVVGSFVVAVVIKIRRSGRYDIRRYVHTAKMQLCTLYNYTLSLCHSNKPQEESIIPLRESTISNEMIPNQLYQSSSYIVTNPHHEIHNPLYSPLTSMSLPPQPTLEEEENDGYAKPTRVLPKVPPLSRGPSNYLEPVSPPHTGQGATQSSATATVLTNRLSGIYEDPDYATIPDIRSGKEESSGASERKSNRTKSQADGDYDLLNPK